MTKGCEGSCRDVLESWYCTPPAPDDLDARRGGRGFTVGTRSQEQILNGRFLVYDGDKIHESGWRLQRGSEPPQ